jgi:hypothetical protein
MNLNQFNLALKMIQDDYKLSNEQLKILTNRLLADEREFDRMWSVYKNRRQGKEDIFKDILRELLS